MSVPPLVLSPCPPSPMAHMSWSTDYHLLTGADLFQVHQALELCTAELCRQIWAQYLSIKKGKSNQVRRASSMLGALPSKHPESCCTRSEQAPNPTFGITPPSLIPCSCILQALVLSGLVFWQLHTWSFMDKIRFRQHSSGYRSSPPMCTHCSTQPVAPGQSSASLQVDRQPVNRPSRIPSRNREQHEKWNGWAATKNIQPHCNLSEQQEFYQFFSLKEGSWDY